MFDTGVYILNNSVVSGNDPNNRSARNQAAAFKLYQMAALSARLRDFISRLTGRRDTLLDLSMMRGKQSVQGGYFAGIKTVSLGLIRGSEGRSEDFDSNFRPRKVHNRQRWINVARASFDGTALPPVELIRYKGDYYVRDGHHRISVSKALGQEAIEAYVTDMGE